jgi:hypothetical protein
MPVVTTWIDVPLDKSWSEFNAASDVYPDAPVQLGQLASNKGNRNVYLSVLSYNTDVSSVEHMFPMWSTP